MKAAGRDSEGDLERYGLALLDGLRVGAAGTIADDRIIQYPRRVAMVPDADGWGTKLHAWEKRLTGALAMLRSGGRGRDRDLIRKALTNAVVWQHKGSPPDLQMDAMDTVWDQWERSDYDGVIERLADQHARVDTHIKPSRQQQDKPAYKRR